MPRPTNANSAETYERIRRAALDVLADKGVEGVSVRAVAARAGVSVGTLRYYFETSEVLQEACLDGFHDSLVTLERQVLTVLRGAKKPRALIAQGIRASFKFLADQPELLRLRMLRSVSRGELPAARRARQRAPFVNKTAAVLKEFDEVRAVNVRLVIDSIMRLIASYASCSDDEARDVTGENDIERAREVLCEHSIQTCLTLLFREGGTTASCVNSSS